MFKKIFAAVSLGLSATFVFSSSSFAADTLDLASFRAVYDVRLAAAQTGSSFSGVSGQIAYGMKKTCDAWLVNQAGTMNVETVEGDVISEPMNFSSWESQDGTQYRFTVMGDSGVDGTILGRAKLTAKGAAGSAEFSRPEKQTFALPAGTMFPAVHTTHILKQAMAGATQFQNMVFEGTDVEGVKLLVTFVSPLSKRGGAIAEKYAVQGVLRQGWTFRLAYFDPQSQAGAPIYEIEADYTKDAIPVRWVLDYGDFSVEMSMSKFERLPSPVCE